MGFLEDGLGSVKLPKIIKAQRYFVDDTVHDLDKYIAEQLNSIEEFKSILPGQRIAITSGSRQISRLPEVTRIVVDALKKKGADPFIIPAMGSHGGATARGQEEMLRGLGICEETVGAPVCSSMEVDLIGTALDGRPVYIDHIANQADGIILINRVKAHTSFRGPYESGLMKMMAIGLGNQKGAQHYHQTGFGEMSRVVEEVGKEVLKKAKISFGVALIENGNGKLADAVCIAPKDIPECEKKLLVRANEYLPKIFVKDIDVLIIKEIGKNISGTGMDCNIIGRFNEDSTFEADTHIKRIAVLDLTDVSHGNANGVGRADFITKRLYDKISLEQTYPNAITSTATISVKIPMILKDDKMAISACIKTSTLRHPEEARCVIIENTKNMNTFYISENLIGEAKMRGVEIVGEPIEIPFDQDGRINLDFTH